MNAARGASEFLIQGPSFKKDFFGMLEITIFIERVIIVLIVDFFPSPRGDRKDFFFFDLNLPMPTFNSRLIHPFFRDPRLTNSTSN